MVTRELTSYCLPWLHPRGASRLFLRVYVHSKKEPENA